MRYDSGLHKICITHSKKMANKKQIFNINVKNFAVSSVKNKSGANNVSDGWYYTLILAKK